MNEIDKSRGCCYCNTGEPLNGYEDVGSFIILPKGKKYYLEIAFSNDFTAAPRTLTFVQTAASDWRQSHEAN